MTTIQKVLSKIATLTLLPALALGIFAAPAMANGFAFNTGVTTIIDVANINSAMVENAFTVKSDTGDNTANGGDGGYGGDSGDSGDNAGNGGDGGEGGDGGDAEAEEGSDTYAESGYGANGGNGGMGGDTGDTGTAGNGGRGGLGGQISTGDAFASVAIANDINNNSTDITVEDNCDCDRYNEYFESADRYFERNRESWATESSEGDDNDWHRNWNNDDESEYSEESSSDSLVKDSHWEVYTKQFVPVTTIVDAKNMNTAMVLNAGEVEAETGDNTANGGDGAEGGDTGDTGDDAGDGGEGGEGGDGGEAEAEGADADNDDHHFDFRSWNHHNDDNDGKVDAIANDGGAGGDGAEGGETGSTGDAGNGADGAEGGLIVTGHADSLVALVNVINRNVTRIVR